MTRHLDGRAVLVTGGTAGIGLATALALGGAGAHVTLTHRWGSHDEGAIRARFAERGAPPPTILEADVAHPEDTARVMATIRSEHPALHVLVSNVAFGPVAEDLGDLTRGGLRSAMRHSAFPLVRHLQAAREAFAAPPRYLVGISSIGHHTYFPGYAHLAAAKAALETYCRYLSALMIDEPIHINIVSAGLVKTASLDATFSPEFRAFHERLMGEGFFVRPEEIADAVLALTSGMMDGVKGAVLTLDRGRGFDDSAAGLYTRRGDPGLAAAFHPPDPDDKEPSP